MNNNFFNEIERKWQKIWEEKKVFEPSVDESKPKFFLTVPYPYMSGLLHLGNAYTFARGEFIARYKRLKRFNVLWPQGWHITGAPIVSKALRLKEGDEKIIKDLKEDGISEKDWEILKTPEGWAMYFIKLNKEAFKKFGFSIDWRREFYTSYLHPWYNKFIEWQYRKLKEKGLITKGTHPVVWDPKVNSVIGDHDRPDEYAGIEPIEGVIIKFYTKYKEKNIILPCFTLRPETIYGVTNIWVNPNAKYILAKVNNEYWILPNTIVIEELKNQDFNVEIIEEININDLLGKHAKNPLTNEEVPILPAKFVNPEIGTGIVMSVPAHAPYDYIALLDLTKDEKWKDFANKALSSMKSLFKVEGFSEFPAKDIVEKMNIKSQEEIEKLEKATQEIYSKEYYNGILKEIYGKYSGKRIYEIKEDFIKELIEKNIALKYYTLPIRFKSRYGGVCIVKIVKDQWFLRYSDPEWKKLAHECVNQMKFLPEELRQVFHNTIDWYKDWAFTHKKELGTPLPWDPEWTIESLSDSTIYMAFYTISHLITKIPPEKIEDDLFDYVFLGKGDENKLIEKYGEIIKEMRREFEYWYPVDLRTSGKDLIQNHLIFYIFHHVAIFPKEKWPKTIAINGWVLLGGRKMSKSLGNYISMLEASKKHPIDVIRFLLAYAGNTGLDDANIELSLADNIKKELIEWYNFCIENYNKGREEVLLIDKWFENVLNKTIKLAEEKYEKMNFKDVINIVWFDLDREFKWYLRRINNNPNKEVINKYIVYRNTLLYPIIPHITSEILEKIGIDPLSLKWPETEKIDETIISLEDYVKSVRSDIEKILNIIKKKDIKEIKIIVAKREKYEIFKELKDKLKEENLENIVKELINRYKNYSNLIIKVKNNLGLIENLFERDLEIKALEEAKEFLEKEFKAKVIIELEENSFEEKAKNALPGKPAIVLK